jgi:hypothetical protein
VIGRAIAEELGFGVVRHSDITRCYRYGSLKMQEAIKAADRFCNREPCRMVFNGLADPERVTKAPYLLLLPECREGMQCAKLNYD